MDPLARLFDRFGAHGDVGALGEVFDRTAPRLLALALHLCGDPAEAEDQVQQTFLRAMRSADSFDRTQPLEPWLAGLLANSVRNGRRRGERRRTDVLPELSSLDEGPMAAAERGELVAMLRTQIGELPVEQRQALLLQLQHGLSPAEIAEVLEVPPGTVRMRVHRGLQALRKLLPAGLAAWCAASVSSRGLAAVRGVVMRRAKEQVVTAATAIEAAAVAGGVLGMKKLLVAIVAVLLVGLAWWGGGAPGATAEPGPSPVTVPQPLVAASAAAGDAAPDVPVTPAADRVGVATAPGSLQIRVLARLAGGTEVAAESRPVGGAVLQVWPGDDPWMPYDGGVRIAETAADGEAVLRELAPGPWQVLLGPDGDEPPRSVQIEPGELAQVDITQPAVRFVTGVVVDPDGAPVAGAEVWIHRGIYLGPYGLTEPHHLTVRRAGLSGPDGRFEVAVADQESRIGARKVGYGASFGRATGGPGDAELRLELGRAFATVSGTVRDAAGTPVAGALVGVTPAGQDARRAADGTALSARVGWQVRSDARGRFAFEGLPPGKQKLWAEAEPRYPGWCEVEVAAFARADVELELPAGIRVVGTVRSADGSPARVEVSARPDVDTNGHYVECFTRADGSYVLPWVPARSFVVTVTQPGKPREIWTHRAFEKPAPGVLRCDFVLDDLQRLHGRVVDAQGQPLAGWQVRSFDEADGSRGAGGRSDDAGCFELLLPLGAAVRVVVAPQDGDVAHPAAELRSVTPGGPPIELRVPPDAMPSATVRGRLVDPGGGALVDRGVVCKRTSPRSWLPGESGRSAADGTFAFGPSSAGEFELRLGTDDGFHWTLAEFALADGEQLDLGDLVVPPSAVLRVEVTRADGAAWHGALPWVRLSDSSGNSVRGQQNREDGIITIETSAGHRRVEITGTDLIASPREVDLVAGETRSLRFAVAIGRSRKLVFNGDGEHRPERGTPLHVVVRGSDGAVVVEADVLQLMPDLRGFRYWYLNHVFAIGRYQVEAHSDTGRRYGATFDVREDLDDATRIEVPSLQ